jgi:hypothetical protein
MLRGREGDPMALAKCLARGASLLVAFSLLASAATAYAECAWVLWQEIKEDYEKKITTTWKLHAAHQTRVDCDHMLIRMWEVFKTPMPDAKTVLSAPGLIQYEYPKEGGGASLIVRREFRCLPETVDPRGPKAK